MKSGMLAAEAAFDALTGSSSAAADLAAYEDSMQSSWVWEELTKERNIRPSYVPSNPAVPRLTCETMVVILYEHPLWVHGGVGNTLCPLCCGASSSCWAWPCTCESTAERL